MEAYWGSGGVTLRILDLVTRWRWVVSFTIRLLYPQGKSTWYPLDRRMGGSQSRSGCGGEEKNSQPLPGLEPPIFQPIAQRYTTELSRFLQDPVLLSYHLRLVLPSGFFPSGFPIKILHKFLISPMPCSYHLPWFDIINCSRNLHTISK
jgi:hypothetical protein